MQTGIGQTLIGITTTWTTLSTGWVFVVASWAGVLCLVVRGTSFARRLAGRDPAARRGLLIGLALFAVAFVLRWILPERVPYTFNDEFEYVAAARRLADSGLFVLTSKPPAIVFVGAQGLAWLGPTFDAVAGMVILLASLTVPVLYWVLRGQRVAPPVALLSAVLLALAPLHVKHAATPSAEIVSLLFLLLAIGTFQEFLRAPGRVHALGFAVSLFFALTSRVENAAVILLLALLAGLWRTEASRPGLGSCALFALVLAAAAAYLPGIAASPDHSETWWKSGLPLVQRVVVNLGFWIGNEPMTRKLPLIVLVAGLVSAFARRPRVATFWLAFLLLFSAIFAFYGLNLSWVGEPGPSAEWSDRRAGHDMFRFNVILLPAVTFFAASGLVEFWNAALASLRARSADRGMPRVARFGVLALAVAAVGGLLAWRGEFRTYHPLDFVASRYNRNYEIGEFRFLRDSFRDLPAGATGYVLPPAANVVLPEVEIRPLDSLDADLADEKAGAPAFVYVSGRQLAVPGLRLSFEALRRRHALHEVSRRRDGIDQFVLFEVRAR